MAGLLLANTAYTASPPRRTARAAGQVPAAIRCQDSAPNSVGQVHGWAPPAARPQGPTWAGPPKQPPSTSSPQVLKGRASQVNTQQLGFCFLRSQSPRVQRQKPPSKEPQGKTAQPRTTSDLLESPFSCGSTTHTSAKGSGPAPRGHGLLPPPWREVGPVPWPRPSRHHGSGKGCSHHEHPFRSLCKGAPLGGCCVEWGRSLGAPLSSKLFPQGGRQETETSHTILASSCSVHEPAWAAQSQPREVERSTPDGHDCRRPPARVGRASPLSRACPTSRGLGAAALHLELCTGTQEHRPSEVTH